ncbi:MAG: di-heme oxidoredictase family protein, partial [Planctomycetota bacterium]
QARRDVDDPFELAGETLFTAVGCADCHVPTFVTSPYHPHAELRSQTIHPYTDLLLHDMGPGLASTLVEGNASESEWRTAPLWSIGLTAGVSGGEGYLHDGRARTLEEAILWHGGEGNASRAAYEALSTADRAALIAFVRSL